MSIKQLAMLSVHTSPLDPFGGEKTHLPFFIASRIPDFVRIDNLSFSTCGIAK